MPYRSEVRRGDAATLIFAGLAALSLGLQGPGALADTRTSVQSAAELSGLSIEDLANIDISSVSKTNQPLSDAPAAIFVITHDEIIRSGATSLSEMLRMAPNLQVAQITASRQAVSARGFNGSAADKLLVLIDGRSVYATYFSGVFWDTQDVPPEDIERIEVISGPGATLWGANAVNGVINIITRSSSDTQGGVATGGGGNLERRGSLQVGARLGEKFSWRAYVTGHDRSDDVTGAGADAKDGWHKVQGGFRADWTLPRDLVTLQGDVYSGAERQVSSPNQAISGTNLLARWTHHGGGSTLQLQAYYDYLARETPGQASDFVHTYDLDVQDSFGLGRSQQIVWGGGIRVSKDRFPIVPGNPSSPLIQFFNPEGRTLTLGNVFAQDTVALTPSLKLTLGLKLEDDPYSGLAPLPSARLSWKLGDHDLLWAAVSRAIRAPSRLDEDLVETLGPTPYLHGGTFKSEKLIAYEVGYRTQPSAQFSASISAFYNVYTDLRSFEPTGGALPLVFANLMQGETYGVEVWGAYQAMPWWRLSGGANWLHKNLRFSPGSAALGGVQLAGDDPDYQLSLRSAMDLPHGLTLDVDLRGVGALPAPASPAYAEMGARLAWPVSRSVELSVTGANLLHSHHPEFGSSSALVQLGATGVDSGRSVSLDARWRF